MTSSDPHVFNLAERMNRIETRLDSVRDDVAEVQVHVGVLEERTADINEKLDRMLEKLESVPTIDARLKVVEGTISGAKVLVGDAAKKMLPLGLALAAGAIGGGAAIDWLKAIMVIGGTP